jgi:nucleotide-binding universal stress UspA family protein
MKILLITDSSNQAENALVFSAQIAQRVAEPPTILTVIPDSKNRLSSRATEILARALELVGVPDARTQVRFGESYENILQEVNEGDFDLVIIGDKRSQNLITRFLWKSTAIKLAECAPCSVIVVRGKGTRIRRILLCDSGAGMSSLLSRLVVQLSDLLEGEEDVTVLHVMSQISASPGVPGGHLRADAQELIEDRAPEGEMLVQDIEMLEKSGIHPTPKVRHGLVVDEILAEARSGDYDLVVVGAHSAGGHQSFLLDNIAHQIIQQVSRPILVVRGKEIPVSTQ